MELKWLEDLLSLARTKSFSRSAAQRNVSQSAFSRRIQALERWVGTPLVDRSTFPCRLTTEGQAFRDVAEQAVRELSRSRDELRATRRQANDTLVFSATHSIALSFFPGWLRTVEDEIGTIDSQMVADNMHNCVQNLTDGACDFLICFTHSDIPLLIDADLYPALPLACDRLIPVCAVADNGGARYPLPGTQEHPLPYLRYAPASFLGLTVAGMLARPERVCHLARHYEDSLAGALTAMARAGHGVAWVPESSVGEDVAHGRLCRAGGTEWDVPFGISIYRSAEHNRPRAAALWAYLELAA